MAVEVTTAAANTAGSPAGQTASVKKTAAPKSKKPRAKPDHPRTSEMVNAAITSLKERGGSSLQAIKKYITATYKIDAEKQASFIKRYLKTAVAGGVLVQTKGKGASGSFKISQGKTDGLKSKPKSKPKVTRRSAVKAAPKKAVVAKATKKPVAAKKTTARKAAPGPVESAEKRKTTKAIAVAKAPKPKATKAKAPSKVKKAVKTPTGKPKAPKPKKAPKTAKPAAKKAVVQKKK